MTFWRSLPQLPSILFSGTMTLHILFFSLPLKSQERPSFLILKPCYKSISFKWGTFMNEISKLSDTNLISEVKRLVSEERRLTADLLHYLCEVRRRRLFAQYGYPSLFTFCVKYLGYTEAQTQRRLEAMKAMIEIPEIEEKIKDGALSLTAVAQAQSYFRSQEKEDRPVSVEAKREVLLSLENKTTRECERELIKLSGEKPLPQEKSKLVSQTHTQVTMNLPHILLEKLERIKSLLSHKNPNMTQAELLNAMADIVLREIDQSRRGVSVARIVNERKCSYVSPITGEKCQSSYFLEIDHIIPKALGGDSRPENLRLLCKTHNQLAAIEVFGLKKMDPFIN